MQSRYIGRRSITIGICTTLRLIGLSLIGTGWLVLCGGIIVGRKGQLGIISDDQFGTGLQNLAFLQRTLSSISQHYLYFAFNTRYNDGFIDDLSTHIHCSKVADLAGYTLEALANSNRCKKYIYWRDRDVKE